MPQDGGFGNMLERKDGTLLSCYSHHGADRETHLEVVSRHVPALEK